MDSPVRADWSRTASPSATAPSTGTTSPLRITSRSPGSIASSATSSSLPFRYRMALRGTRASSAVISRLARRSAKLSRYCPPEYIKATTAAARYSAKTRAASIESAAMMSRPTSPRRRLTDDLDQEDRQGPGSWRWPRINPAACGDPERCAARPTARPVAGHATMKGRRYRCRFGTDRVLSTVEDGSDPGLWLMALERSAGTRRKPVHPRA